ncbi:DUF305 domain-containing protein [Kineococcus auxinigenes]|uniref:DUF305 domain-containing protein n=1 Tax=unclassified Kineococcus TaxID=2621656 RepID=UPI003D7E4775
MSPRSGAGRVLALVAVVLVALVVGVLAGRALPDAPGEQSADVGFARDMGTHHQQAIAMAYEAIQEAPSAEVRQLAVDIASTQGNQLGRMQALLIEWGHPLSGSAPAMAWMAGTEEHAAHGRQGDEEVDAEGDAAMPGMASAEEVARLSQLSGEEFEVLFLQLMLRHHAGGLQMAEAGAELVGDDQLRELAEAILASQSSETQVLEDLLAERGAEPLPFPEQDAA